MALFKLLLISAVVSGFFGFGAFAISEGVDEIQDLDLHWGRGGGGCGRGSYYYRDGNDHYSHCFDESYSETDDGYCRYHDEYFSESEWDDHRDDCPLFD